MYTDYLQRGFLKYTTNKLLLPMLGDKTNVHMNHDLLNFRTKKSNEKTDNLMVNKLLIKMNWILKINLPNVLILNAAFWSNQSVVWRAHKKVNFWSWNRKIPQLKKYIYSILYTEFHWLLNQSVNQLSPVLWYL